MMQCEPVTPQSQSTLEGSGCAHLACGCGSRRAFLRRAGALAASAMLPAPALLAQTPTAPATKPHRIDIHHHFYPPFLMEAWKQANTRIAGPVARWTLKAALEQMDEGSIATAMLSIPTGLNLKGLSRDDTLRMTRMCNDWAIQTGRDNPGRFGLFGFLPMPDIEGSLKEIEYVLDTLKADGIGLQTSYGDKWLGDPVFKPVLEELNRRKAVVFVHPHGPDCCSRLMSYVPSSFIEYPQDTNRTVMSLLFSGSFARTRDIRWIFCHGGAAVPLLAGRVAALSKFQIRNLKELAPDGIDFELKRLYYETANAAYGPNLAALLKFVPLSQVMFGTDYPYVRVTDNAADLLGAGLGSAELKAIEAENALRLLPRLKG
jgi:predicted TIM-barrel fold metal-dependent hydrolase